MNKTRGEFTMVLGQDEYKLAFSINSLCALEEALGKPITEISKLLAEPEKLSITFVRAFLWSGLQKHHPMPIIKAGELLEQHGFEKVMQDLLEGFTRAFPEPDPNHRPTKGSSPQVGNGASSSPIGSNVV